MTTQGSPWHSNQLELSKKVSLTGRNPRIPFMPGQVAVLEETFKKTRYLSGDAVAELAKILQVSETRVRSIFIALFCSHTM